MRTNDFFGGAELPPAGWKRREQMEANERRTLALFAQKSGDSRGRKFPEPRHEYRMEFQRDRARIIHSRAFRRRFPLKDEASRTKVCVGRPGGIPNVSN
jgi:hypothetical protein